ncbi:MAG TPA: hypothetical protein VNA28_08970 [Solirubrobacteraceae bacterium]|nr:hypothetical protein [Solirubrobacteraceae bacterium]
MNNTPPTAHPTLQRRSRPSNRSEHSRGRSAPAREVRANDETIVLDVPAVAAALSRRLYSEGLPVTPEQAVTFAEALQLLGPLSRDRLYCTARTVFVSAPMQLAQFDRVFASVFGD